LKIDELKKDNFKSRKVGGLTMPIFYLSYTKINIFIEIIRFKLMYISGQGFCGSGGSGLFGRFSR